MSLNTDITDCDLALTNLTYWHFVSSSFYIDIDDGNIRDRNNISAWCTGTLQRNIGRLQKGTYVMVDIIGNKVKVRSHQNEKEGIEEELRRSHKVPSLFLISSHANANEDKSKII